MHNGLVTLGGDKMSKSLGNTLSIQHLLQQVRAVELRYYLAAPHYRSSVDFTPALLEEAATAYRRVEGFVVRAEELVGLAEAEIARLPQEFVDAMNDDLAVPQALAVLHNSVREGNAALAEADKPRVSERLAEVRAMLHVLGLDAALQTETAQAERAVIDSLVALALEQRASARERKDYAAADAIRSQLSEAGIVVEDTPAGARWQLRRD
jgi:cysteinyl-tRNA synthetase